MQRFLFLFKFSNHFAPAQNGCIPQSFLLLPKTAAFSQLFCFGAKIAAIKRKGCLSPKQPLLFCNLSFVLKESFVNPIFRISFHIF
jgi:hypothetical protein